MIEVNLIDYMVYPTTIEPFYVEGEDQGFKASVHLSGVDYVTFGNSYANTLSMARGIIVDMAHALALEDVIPAAALFHDELLKDKLKSNPKDFLQRLSQESLSEASFHKLETINLIANPTALKEVADKLGLPCTYEGHEKASSVSPDFTSASAKSPAHSSLERNKAKTGLNNSSNDASSQTAPVNEANQTTFTTATTTSVTISAESAAIATATPVSLDSGSAPGLAAGIKAHASNEAEAKAHTEPIALNVIEAELNKELINASHSARGHSFGSVHATNHGTGHLGVGLSGGDLSKLNLEDESLNDVLMSKRIDSKIHELLSGSAIVSENSKVEDVPIAINEVQALRIVICNHLYTHKGSMSSLCNTMGVKRLYIEEKLNFYNEAELKDLTRIALTLGIKCKDISELAKLSLTK